MHALTDCFQDRYSLCLLDIHAQIMPFILLESLDELPASSDFLLDSSACMQA
jgi:hypothetical protein